MFPKTHKKKKSVEIFLKLKLINHNEPAENDILANLCLKREIEVEYHAKILKG